MGLCEEAIVLVLREVQEVLALAADVRVAVLREVISELCVGGLEVARCTLGTEAIVARGLEAIAAVLDLEGHAVREIVAELKTELNEVLVRVALVPVLIGAALAGCHGAAGG